MPDRVICLFEIKKSYPGGFRPTVTGSSRMMKVEDLLKAFMFGAKAMLFRDNDITCTAQGRETVVEKTKNKFPKSGEHCKRAIVVEVVGVTLFKEKNNNTLTDRFRKFTVKIDMVNDAEEIGRVSIMGKGKEVVRDIVRARGLS